MRYILDWGSTNAGGAPTFMLFRRADTLADLPAPTIGEIGGGEYYFDYDWSNTSAAAITFRVELHGIEQTDVINNPGSSGYDTSQYSTAGTIISRAAIQLGLGSVPDPFASTDPNFVQLVEFLGVAGNDLLGESNWSHLRKTYTFQTVAGQNVYALPLDFESMVDQTGWNRSSGFRLGGPLSAQQWQAISASRAGGTLNCLFKFSPLELTIFGEVPEGQTIAFEYVSSGWVLDADTNTAKKNPSKTGDAVLFDPLLLIRGLKLQWLQAKGFDTLLARAEYQQSLAYEIGRTDGAPVLSLHRRAHFLDRFLDTANLPSIGFGS